MEKFLKKSVSILLLCCMSAGMAANSWHVRAEKEPSGTEAPATPEASEAWKAWEQLPVGEYPITPDSPEWKEMDYSQALEACNMPLEYAQSLSTEDLAKYALNYPFLLDIIAFNSLKDGIDSLTGKSTVFQELFSRPGHTDALLREYQDISQGHASPEESEDAQEAGYRQKLFLEAYLGVNYKDLSPEQADTAFQEHGKKRQESAADPNRSTFDPFYSGIAESMDFSPEDAPPENMGVTYTENKDGTYACDEKTYQYKLLLQGVRPGTDAEGSFLILTDHVELTYYDVWNDMAGSPQNTTDAPEYIILGTDEPQP